MYYRTSVRNLLEKQCRVENLSDLWKDIFITEEERCKVVVTFTTKRVLILKLSH